MSIIVINISKEKGIPYSREGKQIYRVQINNIPLVEFEHYSEDGISHCLISAGCALANINIDEKIKQYEKEQFMKLVGDNDVLKKGG